MSASVHYAACVLAFALLAGSVLVAEAGGEVRYTHPRTHPGPQRLLRVLAVGMVGAGVALALGCAR